MRKIALLFSFSIALILCTGLYAQTSTSLNDNASNPTVMQPRNHGAITVNPIEIHENFDPLFLYDKWESTILTLPNGKEIAGYIKYDLRYNYFSFKHDLNDTQSDILYFDGKQFTNFFIVNKNVVFRNAIDIKGLNFVGFIEEVVDGNFSLLAHYTYEVKKANYIPALDAGETKDKLIRKTVYYSKVNNVVAKIPSSKNKFLQLFNESEQDLVASLLKKEKLKINRREDLVRVFGLLNSTSD